MTHSGVLPRLSLQIRVGSIGLSNHLLSRQHPVGRGEQDSQHRRRTIQIYPRRSASGRRLYVSQSRSSDRVESSLASPIYTSASSYKEVDFVRRAAIGKVIH